MNAGNVFLQKHLQCYEEHESYCTGKYIGQVQSFIESYIAATDSAYCRSSIHCRGKSKRLKETSSCGTKKCSLRPFLEERNNVTGLWFQHENGIVPIPFSGYLFEILSTETWRCSIDVDEKLAARNVDLMKSNRKRPAPASSKCPAFIQVRTIKLYTDHVIRSKEKSCATRKEQEKLKALLSERLERGEEANYKIVSYCRFPLQSAHLCDRNRDISLNRMDRRVAKKIRELANDGVHDVASVQSMLSDYVKNTLFAHSETDEKPSPENTRYFPNRKVIQKHLVAAAGPLKHLRTSDLPSTNQQLPPLVVDVLERQRDALPCSDKTGVGLIAVHGGAGYHSDERWPGYQRLCNEACRGAAMLLKEGGSAGEAVTCAVKILEDSELTNAGYGSNLTEDGKVECDAGVMDASLSEGRMNKLAVSFDLMPPNLSEGWGSEEALMRLNSLVTSQSLEQRSKMKTDRRPSFGAVTGVSCIKNPVCAAHRLATQQVVKPKLSLGRVPPCVMSGDGGEQWAKANLVEMCDAKHHVSECSHKTWQKYRRKLFESLSQSANSNEEAFERYDTVGAVAIDIYGNVASAASSGGLLMKLPGRVGQAAMFGCGCWAENGEQGKPSVAVATSGCGEQLMYSGAAMKCAKNMQVSDQPYSAMQQTLHCDVLNCPLLAADEAKQAGMIALHHSTEGPESTRYSQLDCKNDLLSGLKVLSFNTELVWGHTTKSFLIGHMSTKDVKPEVLISRLPDGATPGKSLSIGGTWLKVAMGTDEQCSGAADSPPPPTTATSVAQLDGTDDSKLSMDADISLMYISTDVDGLHVKDCAVKLSDEFNRKIDPDFESKIDARWQERVNNNPRLFNGSKFRIDFVDEIDDVLQFQLGLTCYRDYMETNWSQDVADLRNKGERLHGNPQAFLAEPLGVAGVLLTSDDQVVFHRRNHWVAEGAGMLDVPGGHPEPTEAAKVDKTSVVSLSELSPNDVINEIFSSQLKEIRDEVNLPLEMLSEARLMGLMRNKRSAGRAVCYFVVRCSLPSSEVERLYREGGVEADESTQILFKHEKDLIHLERDEPSFWSQLCPNGKAAVTLFSALRQVKKGKRPF